MIQNPGGKYVKDTETAPESIIFNTCFRNNIVNSASRPEQYSITDQHLIIENFETFIEKRKKLN